MGTAHSRAPVIIIGAGPAGLAAAVGARSAGAEVLVLEQQPDPAARRRGETVRFDARVEALLGAGFFDRHTRHTVASRRYYSPTGLRQVDRRVRNPNRIIAWPDLIGDLRQRAVGAGAQLRLGWRAEGLRLTERGVAGLQAVGPTGDGVHELTAGFVVAADGHAGLTTRSLGHDRRTIDFPVRKLLVDGSSAPQDRLEYYLHLTPDGTPCIGCSFPRGGRSVELLLLVWPQGRWGTVQSHRRAPLLSSLEDDALWPRQLRRYQEGGELRYATTTQVAMGGLLQPLLPVEGLVMVGGAAGQVQARGGSGIVSSLLLGHAAGRLAGAAALSRQRVGDRHQRAAREAALTAHPVWRELRNMHRALHVPRQVLLGGLKSPASFDRAWPVLRALLR